MGESGRYEKYFNPRVFYVDLDVAWDTLNNHLPEFKKQVEKLIEENQK
jgi:uncharacterized protein with HEPN domain